MTDPLAGKRALVVGANGFLGSHLLPALAAAGAEVHAMSRRAAASTPEVKWWRGSATDVPVLDDIVARVAPDVLYQLASASQGGQDRSLVVPTFEDDLRTSVNSLVVARDRGVERVIITRSLDEAQDGAPCASPYAAAKAASGIYGQLFAARYGLGVVMLRPFMTYGPGQKAHKIIPYVVTEMLRGTAPHIGSPDRDVDWVFVTDVVSAFVQVATAPGVVGDVFDLGRGDVVPIRHVVERIAALIPTAPRPTFGTTAARVDEPVRRADVEPAAMRFNWRATTSLDDGLRSTIAWYRDQLSDS